MLLAFSTLLLQGCALRALDWVTPHQGYQLESDLIYGPQPRQQLDVYRAEERQDGSPVVVFFYGGSWQQGYKEGYRFVAQALAEEGFDVVIPDYRLYPEVRFPDFLNDAALAVAWAERELNPDNGLVLMGHSAGAHIAAMLALDEQYLARQGVSRQGITAWVGLSGPYDFLPLRDPKLISLFGGADDIPDTQPINFVDARAPQALLVHGRDDRLVGLFNAENLTQAMSDLNIPVELRLYEGVRHNATVAAFSPRLRGRSASFDDVVEYLHRL